MNDFEEQWERFGAKMATCVGKDFNIEHMCSCERVSVTNLIYHFRKVRLKICDSCGKLRFNIVL